MPRRQHDTIKDIKDIMMLEKIFPYISSEITSVWTITFGDGLRVRKEPPPHHRMLYWLQLPVLKTFAYFSAISHIVLVICSQQFLPNYQCMHGNLKNSITGLLFPKQQKRCDFWYPLSGATAHGIHLWTTGFILPSTGHAEVLPLQCEFFELPAQEFD